MNDSNPRLLVIVLGFLVIAAALGLYFCQLSTSGSDRIVGHWRHPTPDQTKLGYSSTLSIRRDGTFHKVQRYRYVIEEFTGTYERLPTGIFRFRVTSKRTSTPVGIVEPKEENISFTDDCRCAVDAAGVLIIATVGINVPVADIGLRWETYEKCE